MINLKCKHGTEDGMAQMIIAFISGKEGEQMLNRVIHMLLCGDFLVIPIQKGFAILFCAVLGDLGSGEHSVRRQEMKRIGRRGLSAAMLVGFSRDVGLYAGYDRHHSSSFASSLSKHSALQDSM